MSRLLADQLVTTLFQTVTPTENVDCRAMYMSLYKNNLPSGNLTLQVQDTNSKLIKASNAVTIASIDAAVSNDDFAHGLFRFDLIFNFRKNATYRLVLVPGGGYSFTSNDYISWKRDFDHTDTALRRVGISYTGGQGYNAPYDFLAVERKTLRKGVL